MKLWRRSVNKIIRSRAKQTLRTCADYDAMLMPVHDDGGTLWDSPRDGRGAWFWKVYSWWDAEQEARWRADYEKGFRK